MEELLNILEDLNPDVDYETETKLIDNGLLDSMASPVAGIGSGGCF